MLGFLSLLVVHAAHVDVASLFDTDFGPSVEGALDDRLAAGRHDADSRGRRLGDDDDWGDDGDGDDDAPPPAPPASPGATTECTADCYSSYICIVNMLQAAGSTLYIGEYAQPTAYPVVIDNIIDYSGLVSNSIVASPADSAVEQAKMPMWYAHSFLSTPSGTVNIQGPVTCDPPAGITVVGNFLSEGTNTLLGKSSPIRIGTLILESNTTTFGLENAIISNVWDVSLPRSP
uniref:Pectate lyase n=1 Tax=Coccolithus braarudii TaxID=221442 RepID=A0A7S0Q901_9EUKA